MATQATETVCLVTYIEARPSHAAAARAVLRDVRAARRSAAAARRVDLLERRHQPNHFVMLERLDGSTGDASAAPDWPADLTTLCLAPCETRIHAGFALGPEGGPATPGDRSIWVVTHVDIVPAHKDAGLDLLARLQAASAADAGNLRFDVWQQADRANHLTVVERWRDEVALDGHRETPHVLAFRRELAPLSGALYDERLYRALD